MAIGAISYLYKFGSTNMVITRIFLFFAGMITLSPAWLHSSEINEQPCQISLMIPFIQKYLNNIDQSSINQNPLLREIYESLTGFKSLYEDGNALQFEVFDPDIFNIEVPDSLIATRDNLKSANNVVIAIHHFLGNPLDEYRYKLDRLLNKYNEATEEQKEFFTDEIVSFCEKTTEEYPVFSLKIYQMLVIKNHLELIGKLSEKGIACTQEEMRLIKRSINSLPSEELNHYSSVFPLMNISDLKCLLGENPILGIDVDDTLVFSHNKIVRLKEGEVTLETFNHFPIRFAITARGYDVTFQRSTYEVLKELGLEFTGNDNYNCTFSRSSGFYKGIFHVPFQDFPTKDRASWEIREILRKFFPKIEENLFVFVDDTPRQVAKLISNFRLNDPKLKCIGFVYLRENKTNI